MYFQGQVYGAGHYSQFIRDLMGGTAPLLKGYNLAPPVAFRLPAHFCCRSLRELLQESLELFQVFPEGADTPL